MCSIQDFSRVVRPPNWGRQSSFLVYSSNVNLIQKDTHRHIQYRVWPNIWATCGPIELMRTINHRRDASANSHPCSRRQEGPQVALDWGQPVISLRAAWKSTPYSLTSPPVVPTWGYSEGSRVSLLCRRLAGADQFLKGWRGLCSPQAPEGHNTPCVGPPVLLSSEWPV